jgi:Rrf2 family transcriptional regulator, iron-sulfur cluster assembly transcription factor
MLSQTAEYALRAALFLAEHPDRMPARVGDLAGALRVPQNYLSKTLHQLARAGVLASTRGKHGGFRLARDAGEITLLEIVAPFEHFDERRQCILGRAVCSDAAPCQAHLRWKEVQERTTSFFRDTTLRDLIRLPAVGRPSSTPRGRKARGRVSAGSAPADS